LYKLYNQAWKLSSSKKRERDGKKTFDAARKNGFKNPAVLGMGGLNTPRCNETPSSIPDKNGI